MTEYADIIKEELENDYIGDQENSKKEYPKKQRDNYIGIPLDSVGEIIPQINYHIKKYTKDSLYKEYYGEDENI